MREMGQKSHATYPLNLSADPSGRATSYTSEPPHELPKPAAQL